MDLSFLKGKTIHINKGGYYEVGKKLLHRLIWENHHGPIPFNHCIHHKDENKLNNSINNLECMPVADHMRHHALANKEQLSKCMSKNSKVIHAWLKTDMGKKFLSDKKKREWENAPVKTFTCESCKIEFQTKHNKKHVKFCSDKCVMLARNKSGVDNVERSCIICSNPFIINRYQKTVTCSKPCRAKHIGNVKRKS